LILNNQSAILSYTTSGTSLELFNISSNNNLSIGYSMAGVGGSYIYGNEIYLRYGSSRTTGLTLNSSGNVTIGSSDLAGTEVKLHVADTRESSSYLLNARFLSPNLLAGGTSTIIFGKSESTKNRAYIGYRHNSDGSDNNAITFGFYGKDKIVNFLANGNVLIGTTTDNGAKLQVNGGISATGQISTAHSLVFNGNYGIWKGNRFTGSLTENDIAYNAAKYVFFNGNVGIGTTNPQAKLQVAGNVRVKGFIESRISGGYPCLNLMREDADTGWTISYRDAEASKALIFYRAESGTYSATVAMRLNGNVGIGTVSPAYKLDVAGTGRFTGKTTHDGGIDIPNGQQLAFLDASGNRHTIAWDSASNGILIDGNLIVLGELATGLPMQEIPSIPEIGV
jgi:hypothetical protein